MLMKFELSSLFYKIEILYKLKKLDTDIIFTMQWILHVCIFLLKAQMLFLEEPKENSVRPQVEQEK